VETRRATPIIYVITVQLNNWHASNQQLVKRLLILAKLIKHYTPVLNVIAAV